MSWCRKNLLNTIPGTASMQFRFFMSLIEIVKILILFYKFFILTLTLTALSLYSMEANP